MLLCIVFLLLFLLVNGLESPFDALNLLLLLLARPYFFALVLIIESEFPQLALVILLLFVSLYSNHLVNQLFHFLQVFIDD